MIFFSYYRLATTFEAIAYTDLAGIFPFINTIMTRTVADKLVYICLDLLGRSIFEFISFTCITELWMQTALYASPTQSKYLQSSLLIQTLNRVLGAFAVLLSISLCVFLLMDTNHDLYYIEHNDLVFRLQLLMETLCWIVAAILVCVAVRITYERIQQHFDTFPPSTTKERYKLLGYAIGPMILCCFCYLIRSMFLACRLLWEKTWDVTTRFGTTWWICFVWLPTLLVVTVALYSARRRDVASENNNSSSNSDNNSTTGLAMGIGSGWVESDHTEPLLNNSTPSIPPPVEAFQNFRRFSAGIISPFGNKSVISTSPTQTTPPSSFVPPSPDRASQDAGSNLGDLTEM